jgi:drug/metabolite transporter (DMT)-like permease
MMSTKPSAALPVASLLVAATLWGVSWYPLRVLESNGLQGLWITVIVYVIPAVAGSIFLYPRRWELRREPAFLFIVALGNGWCNVAFILAVLDGNVMRVLLLFYLSPVWATVLAWWLLNERLTWISLATLAVAMVGAVVMLWNPSLGMPWPTSRADWLAISSGMAFALANVAVRKTQDISIPIKNLCSWVGVAVLAGVWLLLSGAEQPVVSQSVWLWTVLLGPLIVFTMTFTVQYGVTKLPVHRSAVILLFELVAGAISSQLLTNEVMRMQEWGGGAIIVLAAYLYARASVEDAAETGIK